jgi:hypothetical protein
MAKENRITSYPNPLIIKKIKEMSEQKNMSKSKVVNEALNSYFIKNPLK